MGDGTHPEIIFDKDVNGVVTATPQQQAALRELELLLPEFSEEEVLAALLPDNHTSLTGNENVEHLQHKTHLLSSTWQRVYETEAFMTFQFDEGTESKIRRHKKKDTYYNQKYPKKERLRRVQIFRAAVFAGQLAAAAAGAVEADKAETPASVFHSQAS